MKELLHNIDNKNKWLIAAMGALCFVLYVIFLYFRPQESWCDDAFWADWARQLAEHNRYYTTVWGFGHPSYCPLYVFLMALWYKVVGFSFFTAQFPNILLALIIYWVLMLILAGRKHITTWQGVVCLSALFWFSPSMCGICNCGRIEMLCLLLGILTSYFFVRSIETALLKDKIALFICSLLLFATGVEGVVFSTIFVLIYSVFHYREMWQNKMVYVWHFGGYVTSLGVLGIITYKTHCLHQFFDTMFGFSKTFTSLYLSVRAFIKGAKHGDFTADVVSHSSSPKPSLMQSLIDGYTMNYEYLILITIIVILFAYLWYAKKWRNLDKATRIILTMALITPLIYVLAGRYVSYYTWAAYIPSIIAITLLLGHLRAEKLFMGISCLMALWFFYTPTNSVLKSLDFSKQKDKQNIADIQVAAIDPSIPTVIPYSWYYYIVKENENIWFQASGAYPDDLAVIIYAPNEYNEEQFMNRYVLQERCRIGNKIVYDIISRKE